MNRSTNSLCLFIPDFSLQSLFIGNAPPKTTAPIGVLDSSRLPDSPSEHKRVRLLCFNSVAAEFNLYSGMKAAHAIGRCSNLELFPRSADLESKAQSQLLKLAESFSPDFENTAPGIVNIDLTGSRSFSKAGEAYLTKTCPSDALSPLKLTIGLSHTPELAQLAASLAHQSGDVFKRLEQLRELEILPIQHLTPFIQAGERAEILRILDLWGIRHIGDFLKLDPQETTRRLGSTAYHLHRKLSSSTPRLLSLHRPSSDLFLRHEIEHPVKSLTPLLFLFHRLLKTLGNRLRQQAKVASTVGITLGYENGQRYQRKLRVASPSTDTERLRELIASHLQNFTAKAPICWIRLELVPSSPIHLQNDAFEQRLRDPNHFAETLARIEAIVGQDNIGRPLLGHSHKPDDFQLASWRTFLQKQILEPGAEIQNSQPPRLPLQRYRPPKKVHVEVKPGTRPAEPILISTGPHTGSIIKCSKPRPLSGHWWEKSQHWRHIEWDVQLNNSPFLRLTQTPDTWMLEGIFL